MNKRRKLQVTMRSCLYLFAFVGLFSSCVPNHKVTLLQKDDLHTSSLLKDSTIRQYPRQEFEYRIQTHDLISIQFESVTTPEYDFLSTPAATQNLNVNPVGAQLVGELVDEEGYIPFPVIGRVRVAGLTVFQVQETLRSIASQYLESPVVKVRLLNFRFTLLGEVNQEGTVMLHNGRVSLLEAIGLAGGLGELADRSNVKIIRQTAEGTKVFYVDLLREEFLNSPGFYIHQNDVVIVPGLKQRPFRRYFGQNLSLVVSTLSLLFLALNLTR